MSARDSKRTGAHGGGVFRRRVRGMCGGKTGKTIGFASIAAPVLGYVVNDLKKPDSVIRSLVTTTVRRLLPSRSEEPKAIDITDRVEIIEIKDNKTN